MTTSIPSQRTGEHDQAVLFPPICDHEICNSRGIELRPEDVDFILRCLQETGAITKTDDGHYRSWLASR